MKENLLEKCPLCGARVVFAYNNSSKQGYYKCSNTGCHFRLGMNYSEKEVSLQGITLDAECKGCGSSLTVANGPKGLYATCLRCNYDTTPNMVNGFVFKKHANAHNIEAQEEIEELKKAYKGMIDEDYSFDDFLRTEEELQEDDACEEETLFKNVKRENFIEYYNKGYTINQLSHHFNISRNEVRGMKNTLLKEGVISTYAYVKNKHPRASVLDNIVEEAVEEIVKEKKQKKIRIAKTPRGGSSLESLVNFLKKNANRKLSAKDLYEETGIGYSTICNYLTQLRKTKTIKIVGYEGNANPYTIQYSIKESPISELEVVKESGKYVTSAKFFKKHANELAKIDIQTPTFLNRLIEKYNPKEYMMLTPQGLRKTYLESELLALIKPIKKEGTPAETKKRVTKSYSKENYFLKIGDVVLDFLRKNINTPYSIQDVSKATKINENSVSSALKVMRNQGKVKIVGNDETRMLFQATESPIPELNLKSDKEYISLYNFYQNNKNVASSLSKFESEVASVGLPSYKIITRRGIGDGYNIKELKKLFLNKAEIKKSEEVTENVEIPVKSLKTTPINHKKNFLGFVTSVFKNEKTELESEELISF